jgi:hypothetical protein
MTVDKAAAATLAIGLVGAPVVLTQPYVVLEAFSKAARTVLPLLTVALAVMSLLLIHRMDWRGSA